MASQVPYSPTPSIAPEDRPIPSMQINAPESAFGSATAAATQHLGQVADNVGNELFARAYAIQQLNEKADADAAMTDYMAEVGKQFADYKSKSGKDAVAGLPDFQKSIAETREKIAGRLTSTFAVQAFNQQSRSMEGRTTMAAAAHSGNENKSYMLGTAHDRAEADGNYAMQHPDDEDAYQQALKTNRQVGELTASVMGRDKDYADNHTFQLNNNLTAKRISGALGDDPFIAQSMLDTAIKAGTVDSDTAKTLQGQIRTATLTKVTAKEAAEIYNDPANKGKSAQELRDIAEQRSKSLGPDDPEFKDALIQKVEQLRGRDDSIKRATQFNYTNILQGAVYGVGMKDGKLPGSVEELPSDAKAAYLNSDPKTQGAINRRLSYNAIHGDYAPTPENMAYYHTLRGMLTDLNATPAEREKALNVDMNDLHMPNEYAQKLLDLRNKVFNNTMKDNFLPKAMSIMRPILDDPAVGISKTRNPTSYYKFNGTFGEALSDLADKLKRPPNDKEIKELGTQLMQDIQVPGMFFGTNSKPLYTDSLDSGYKEKVLGIYKKNGMPTPSDEQIRQLQVTDKLRMMTDNYNKLFGGKTTNRAVSAPVPSEPEPPRQ